MMTDLQTQKQADIDQLLSQICKLNIDSITGILGVRKNSRGYRFDFFNREILFDHNDFFDISGEALQPAIKLAFCQYLLNHPANPPESSGKLVTFREFSEAGPLFSRFSENTNKTIEQTYSNRLVDLEKKCRQLFGIKVNKPSYDLSFRFKALPKIPVIIQFNDTDELLPASSTLLFHGDAENYLDKKSLATIATYLTGLLIRQ
jgi:hypothetical protein